jgi:predicted DNA-binding antitoxin AbrB/MazE fold protein
MTIRAIYANGVFTPTEPVSLPDKAEVEIEARLIEPETAQTLARHEEAQRAIYEILSRTYDTDDPGLSERHNEHQP